MLYCQRNNIAFQPTFFHPTMMQTALRTNGLEQQQSRREPPKVRSSREQQPSKQQSTTARTTVAPSRRPSAITSRTTTNDVFLRIFELFSGTASHVAPDTNLHLVVHYLVYGYATRRQGLQRELEHLRELRASEGASLSLGEDRLNHSDIHDLQCPATSRVPSQFSTSVCSLILWDGATHSVAMNEGVWDFTMSTSRTSNDVISTSLLTPFQEVAYSNTEPRLRSFYAHDLISSIPLSQFVSHSACQ
jgi:hypothetical protein